ncbi:MAG: hypothetical protein ABFD46_02590 [Armatimonadota bacterium]
MPISQITDPKQSLERTIFQTASPYDDRIDLKSDVVMVYGIDPGLPERIKTWREQGYRIHVMTGASWGNYGDFVSGEWDGQNHEDAAQTDKNGDKIMHNPGSPYMCPTETYGKYLCVGVKRAIDAGAEAIHMEEPEFWVRGGYSEAFKREWKAYYGDEWIAPHTSPDAQYRASKLKYYLYRRALSDVFEFIRSYSKEIGRDVKCYVPTHSIINYAQWRIVSPEASLVQIPGCDGYIGQVWTGTSRTKNRYGGVEKERTFEMAFFEYGVLHNLVRSTGKRMWYLNDPIEDDPNRCWADYKRNWESTLVASLLWPDVCRFEVMPWPARVFTHPYPVKEEQERKPGEDVEREFIPAGYATEVINVANELNNMDQEEITWDCGTRGLGVLVSDTMMFQRGEPRFGDGCLGSFFGLAMPLIKHGAPVEPVQLENAVISDYLKPYKVLFLTCEGMKPPIPELHDALAGWVKSGGVLVFVDDDKDPYNGVKEWWNTSPFKYTAPRQHLFEKLGVSEEGTHQVGKGYVIYAAVSPDSLSRSKEGKEKTLELAKSACSLSGLEWRERAYMLLRRGPYVIGAALDETDGLPQRKLNGSFMNLFSPSLEILDSVSMVPGSRWFLLDMDKVDRTKPKVLASASKVLDVNIGQESIDFHSEGPAGVVCAARIAIPRPPKDALVDGEAKNVSAKWDEGSKTLLLTYDNSPKGRRVKVSF